MATLSSPGNATTLLGKYTTGRYGSGITSGELSGSSHGIQTRGGGLSLQKSPTTSTSAPRPYKEPGQLKLRTRSPQQLKLRKPLTLKPAPTPQNGHGVSNTLNASLQRQRQNVSHSGNRTTTSGPRGTTQAANNINRFGSTRGNVASNPGTSITGSTRTNTAIQAWNKAKAATQAAPQGTYPAVTATAGTTATAAGGGGLFAPVASTPAGVTLGLGLAALGGGLYLGNKIYEGLGSPFGPSLGDHLNAALGKNNQTVNPKETGVPTPLFPENEPNPTTYGQAGKSYHVTYKTKTDYGPNHSDGPRTNSWRKPETRTWLGPIGSGRYTTPRESSNGETITGEVEYISSPSANTPFKELSAVSAVYWVGSGNITVFDVSLEILEVVDVDNSGNPFKPTAPNPIERPTHWPNPGDLPDFSPSEKQTPNGGDAPTGYAPENDYNANPTDAVTNGVSPALANAVNTASKALANKLGTNNNSNAANNNPSNPNQFGLSPNKTSSPPGTTQPSRSTSSQSASGHRHHPDLPHVDLLPPVNPLKPTELKAQSNDDNTSHSSIFSFPLPPLPNKTTVLELPSNKKASPPPTTKNMTVVNCNGSNSRRNEDCCDANTARLDQLLEELTTLKKVFDASGFGTITMTECGREQPYRLSWGGSGLYGLYYALAQLSEATSKLWEQVKCPPDTNAAIPMAWETKAGEHPQLIILWKPAEGGDSRWSMHIPHPKRLISDTYNFNFPIYIKGRVRGSLVLNDNSKVVVNGNSEAECKKVLSYAKTLIESSYLTGSREIFSKGGANNKVQAVKAVYIKSFAGHLEHAPLWVKTL